MYRDPDLGLHARLRELVEQRRREIQELPPGPARVHSRRLARETAAAGMLATTIVLAATMMAGEPTLRYAPLIFGFAIVSGAFGWFVARRKLARAIRAVFEPTFDVVADVDRLERTTPHQTLLALCDHEEPRSVVMPVIARATAIPFFGAWLVTLIGPDVGEPGWVHDAFDPLPVATLGGMLLLAILLGRGMRLKTMAALGWRYCPAPSDATTAAWILSFVLAVILGATHVARALAVPEATPVLVPLCMLIQVLLAAPLAASAYTVARNERERLGLV